MSDPKPNAESGSLRRLMPVDSLSPPLQSISAVNSFVGRREEIQTISQMLLNPEVRLLTLMGPAGVGKTRLALHVAQQIKTNLHDGVRFVFLAGITDPTRVIGEIATSLGFKDAADPSIETRLQNWLRSRHMLLVIDNLEQVVESAPQISTLLRTCPDISVLATSRVKLDNYGEHILTLSPLSFSQSTASSSSSMENIPEAIRLFVDRAKAANVQFELTDANELHVREICRQVDGLPLAIELAAAHSNVLSVTDLRRRLQDRLSILTSTSQDVPDRLRTMQNAIAWSYDLLDDSAKSIFRTLSIFSNGFTLDAAAAILEENSDDLHVLQHIESLVASSLLMRESSSVGTTRFRMLEVIREFGHQQLANEREKMDIQKQHLKWAMSFSQHTGKSITGQDQRMGLRSVDAERDNIKAALSFALELGDARAGLLICSSLWLYWNTRGMISEGLKWTNAFLQLDVQVPDAVLSAALFTQGILYSHLGDQETARPAAVQSFKLAQEIGDPLLLALSTYLLGLIANQTGNWQEAEENFTAALQWFTEAGEHTAHAAVMNDLGRTAYLQGNMTLAGERFNTALSIARDMQMPRSISMSLHNLGNMAIEQHDLRTAAQLNLECLVINLEHGDDWHIVLPLIGLIRIASESGFGTLAARLTGVAEAMVDQPGMTLWDWSLPDDYAQTLETTKKILSDEKLQVKIAEGRQLSIDDAIAQAQILARSTTEVDLSAVLTPREHDVYKLLLADRSDRDIGEELFISHRTVQTHLTSIYRKLGVHSRTEVIEWAASHINTAPE